MAMFEKMNRVDQLLEEYYPHKPGWYIAYGWFYDRVLDIENDEWILDPDTPEGMKKIEELLPQAWVGARVHDLRKDPARFEPMRFYRREDDSWFFSQYVMLPRAGGGNCMYYFNMHREHDDGESYLFLDIGHGADHQWAGIESCSGDPDSDAMLDIILPGWRDVLAEFDDKCVKFLAENDPLSQPKCEDVPVS